MRLFQAQRRMVTVEPVTHGDRVRASSASRSILRVFLTQRASGAVLKSSFGPRRRRWLRVSTAFLLALAACHAPLLHCLAWMLVADDGPQTADDVVVLWCESCYDRASELYHQGKALRFHHVEPPNERLVSLGILPSWPDLFVTELGRRGVPSPKLTAIRGPASEPWGLARSVQGWLQQHPGARLTVLCNRFESGAVRFAFSSVLSGDEFGRVAFWCPSDPRFDETNWWHSGAGRREFAEAVFAQVYFRLHGEDAGTPTVSFDPDAYEQGLN